MRRKLLAGGVAGMLALSGCTAPGGPMAGDAGASVDPANCASFGRTTGSQHYSPLERINAGTVAQLGLAWFHELPPGNSVSAPVAHDGVVYTATGYSVITAFDAAMWGGGAIATGGNLVFQGQMDHRFNAYDARSARRLWSFDARAPVIAPPITYEANGAQYVTVLTGYGVSAGVFGRANARFNLDYRTMPRRVLTFAIGGKEVLPPSPAPGPLVAADDPGFAPDPARAARGKLAYRSTCHLCHGMNAVAAGAAPDLRGSGALSDSSVFHAIVGDGALLSRGMPRFDDLPPETIDDIRFYLRTRAHQLPPAS